MTSPAKSDLTDDAKHHSPCKQTLKKQITCSFELEKMENQTTHNQPHQMNRTNSYIEKDEYIIDATSANTSIYSKSHQVTSNHNHLGHGGNPINLNENFGFANNQFHLHRSDECENLAEEKSSDEKNHSSHLKRTNELETLINNEINNDE
jgi:hypothetical protein